MPVGRFVHRIRFHRRRARALRRVARRRHFRAALVARRALRAKARGHHLRARRLLHRALHLKAAAARAGLRARLHQRRIAHLRRARRARARRR
jgi:hypothetical protein